ncbi:DUF1800 domain-containing protein [Thalassotalea psychrophila]|uniref:DUF1800 domain-containing protein n=1 Tax=Thalassotalea psychrophila TaxID=3065647 RepID=A0ABY9TWC4_9GAMM|nr:DUF1800 domain-containing protein [Colwelliaceae bacterium SQ149]
MSTTNSKATIAANRFGLGAKPGELELAKQNPKKWLAAQLTPVVFDQNLPSSNDVFLQLSKYQAIKRQNKKNKVSEEQDKKDNKVRQKFIQTTYRKLASDTFVQSINSDNSLAWRLLDFFSNHFSVSANGNVMTAIAATLEREAIAANLFNNFEDMLLAVSKHPAMLTYLNNERSFGPNSKLATKSKKAKKGVGLNENLAREILELHTLGVKGGYSQADVIELAKGITGWSVANSHKEDATGFIYRAWGKEPGNRVLLGKTYKQKGIKQGEAMLKGLANHPNTAKFICHKLVKHFISDNPDSQLVDILVKRWQETGGNIKEVMLALINSEQAWHVEQEKFKTPREFLQSTYRALPQNTIKFKQLFFTLNTFGQQPFQAGSPAGFSDEQQDWDGGNALMSKIDWTTLYASRIRSNAENIMNNTLALASSHNTYKAVVRAESRKQALVMLLMSPEFLRR